MGTFKTDAVFQTAFAFPAAGVNSVCIESSIAIEAAPSIITGDVIAFNSYGCEKFIQDGTLFIRDRTGGARRAFLRMEVPAGIEVVVVPLPQRSY